MATRRVPRWLAIGAVASIAACAPDSNPAAAGGELTTRVDPSSFQMTIGEVLNLRAVVTEEDGTRVLPPITWTTTNPGIASVESVVIPNSAVISAHAVGTVTLRAQHPGGLAEATVSVRDGAPVHPSFLRGFYPEDRFTSAGIEWGAVSNATSYRITRIRPGEINPSLNVTVPGDVTQYIDTGLSPGQEYRYSVFALNAFGGSRPTEGTFYTAAPELVVEGGDLPWGKVGRAYDVVIPVTGGIEERSWSIVSGRLPDGLDLDPAGRIHGVPTEVGTSSTSVRLKVVSARASTEADFRIRVALPLSIQTSRLPDALEGQAYTAGLRASGGVYPLSWELVSGTPPAGLVLDASGALQGLPTQPGESSFMVRVSDVDESVTAEVSATTLGLDEFVRIQTSSVHRGRVGLEYRVDLEAIGGPEPYEWSLRDPGTLPPGLHLSPSGRVSGRPFRSWNSQTWVQARSGAVSDQVLLNFDIGGAVIYEGLSIEVDARSSAPADVVNALADAAFRWGRAVQGELEDVIVPQVAAVNCGSDEGGLVNDLRITLAVQTIDGPGGAVAAAGPCLVRGGGRNAGLPVLGVVIVDVDDLLALRQSGLLQTVMTHEVGHVLGIGTIAWPALTEGSCTADPRYRGEAGNYEWRELGQSGGVPLENLGTQGDGSNCGHWRESVLGNELMTPVLGPGLSPLSRVTLQALFDIGFTVDILKADQYSVAPQAASPTGEGALRIGDRILVPVMSISPTGTVRSIGPPDA